ncbi:MAG: DUF5115 domain-containing protein [Mediterranea massiliensis]|nr:DUF5115 domain-containing protein [Mediterranea massiliensis]
MKKTAIYAFALLSVLFTGCTEDFKDWAEPQGFEQEEAKSVSLSVSAVSAIDMANVSSETISVFTPSVSAEGSSSVSYLVEIEGTTFETDAKGSIKTQDLIDLTVAKFGKRPDQRTLKGTVTAYVNMGEQVIKATAPIEIKITLVAPVIESAYYLIGGMNDWTADNADALIKLSHSGLDVYDDPVFSTIIEVGDACYWKVVPQSVVDKLKNGEIENVWNDEDNILGGATDGDTSLTGLLTIGSRAAMQIEKAGWVKISLNMMDYAYTVELLGNVSPYLYVVGDHIDGWNPELASYIYSTDFMAYSGYANLNSQFKLTSEKSWNGTNYGFASETTLSTDGGAGNLTVATPGFYYIQADITAMTWKTTEIKTYGLIGDATEGGWDVSTPMTFDAATSTYTVTATLVGGKSFKFRANDGWDINLGGNMSNLAPNGDNIPVAEDGTYEITLDLSDAANYKATIVKK